jgi:hypothetical protein
LAERVPPLAADGGGGALLPIDKEETMRPKTPKQAAEDWDRKERAREAKAKRAARGISERETKDGAGERSYQAKLEAKGQLRMFGEPA